MKGFSHYYRDVSVDDAISMYEQFGDFIECDADSQIATDIIYLEIDIKP
ncbi:hypothetical protein RIU81_15770 [Salmonella enterica subsp. enterica serovar Gatineau]|nr:hypothetical protein [Salmonella enterica]EEO3502434.1 hypothetical protein [Salmonella enterica subsp. enterica serovar Kintambo]MDR7936720.1 hypothetical protein [Salmonella enterica subsp. enterica serovar Gatineau]